MTTFTILCVTLMIEMGLYAIQDTLIQVRYARTR